MDNKTFRPMWRPDPVPSREWTIESLKKYLGGRSFTVYAHGTCVVWTGNEDLETSEVNQRLRAVVQGHPDFKVQRHIDGNYLVTFKGGVGGLMSGELLTDNLAILRQEAKTFGMLPSEQWWPYLGHPRNGSSLTGRRAAD